MMRNRLGFTLVEGIMAFAIGAGLLGTVTGFLSWGSKLIRGAERRMDTAEETHTALLRVRRAIQDATVYQIAPSYSEFLALCPAGRTSIRSDPPAQALVMQQPGASSPVRIPIAGLKAFYILPITLSLVRFVVQVSPQSSSGKAKVLTYFDDVDLSAVRQRIGWRTWNRVP